MRVLGECPACGQAVTVRRLECRRCGTAVEGRFDLSPFDQLNPEQVDFLLLFLRSRGNIRDVERELSLSYPTVRGRLDAILKRLGLEPPDAPPPPSHERLEVLEAIRRGELSVDQAVQRLGGRDGGGSA